MHGSELPGKAIELRDPATIIEKVTVYMMQSGWRVPGKKRRDEYFQTLYPGNSAAHAR